MTRSELLTKLTEYHGRYEGHEDLEMPLTQMLITLRENGQILEAKAIDEAREADIDPEEFLEDEIIEIESLYKKIREVKQAEESAGMMEDEDDGIELPEEQPPIDDMMG